MAEDLKEAKVPVYIAADNITSPLGLTSSKNFEALKQGRSGIATHNDPALSAEPVTASLFAEDDQLFQQESQYTRFEQLLVASIKEAITQIDFDTTSENTILILSSTKGNISLLETEQYNDELAKRIALHTSAKLIQQYFGFKHQPVIISNACISGVSALLTGTRLIRTGQYENAVVVGADVISKFIVTGFQSFKALSAGPCKPFDRDRDGLNLGEGAATVILSSADKFKSKIKVAGGAVSDDANHISGPSRTGEELGMAIKNALTEAHLTPQVVGMISAHGTATPYNDEMEAKAITYAGLANAPLNSLKGYYGHTLGAAGLIESVITLWSMKESLIIPTLGFNELGTTPVEVNTSLKQSAIDHAVKTASGFGGCNAAIVFSK
jgi:3-oxoacyl-[acyl-carrier-protein] synthase-1